MKGKFEFLLFRRLCRAEVVKIAQAHAESRGWWWEEPLYVDMGLFTAHVMTNAEYKGGNVHVWVSLQTGEVKNSQYMRR